MAPTRKDRHTLSEQVSRLTAEVEQLKSQLQAMRGGNGSNGHDNNGPRSRRDILRMAGVAAIGAAGAVVARGTQAEAIAGQPVLLGAINDSNATTNLIPSNGTAPTPVVQLYQGTPPTPGIPTNGTDSLPLLGAVGVGGPGLPTVAGVVDYPGFAPIQGVGGMATIPAPTGGTQQVSEGLNGYGFGLTGIGVTGESDLGYGVVGGGGIDIAALGSGRLMQAKALDSELSNPPAGPPAFVPNDFEQLRDGNGILWLSHPAPAGAAAAAHWRRVNSIIPITPSRIVDTRIAVGGIQGPLAADSMYSWGPIPGATIVGGSRNGQPNGVDAHAIGIIGNVTVTQQNVNGFLAVMPKGAPYDPNSSPSTLNFSPGFPAWANAFTTLLGTGSNAGSFSIWVGHAITQVVVDVVAYIV